MMNWIWEAGAPPQILLLIPQTRLRQSTKDGPRNVRERHEHDGETRSTAAGLLKCLRVWRSPR